MVTRFQRRSTRFLPLIGGGIESFSKCRWACGNDCFHNAPNTSDNETFSSVLECALSRRAMLKVGGTAAIVLTAAAAPAGAAPAAAGSHKHRKLLGFTPIQPNTTDAVVVPDGYDSRVVVRWGDPILPWAPDFDFDGQSPRAQAGQFGYNVDFLAFLPLPRGGRSSRLGLLWANHEYTDPELMFRGYESGNPTREQAEIEWAAHGASVVLVERKGTKGPFRYRRFSRYNRRITATTPIRLAGPAAGDALLKTTADPSGKRVRGMLNNCAGGTTPWGTVLTGEENFNQYFANLDQVADARTKAWHTRYGLPAAASERKWESFDDRFDLGKQPNEAFRFGWLVEVDPYDPDFTPRKRTALGRMKHEAGTTTLTADHRVAVYMGDDERFDYFYKFVSDGRYRPWDRRHNLRLLDKGTL